MDETYDCECSACSEIEMPVPVEEGVPEAEPRTTAFPVEKWPDSEIEWSDTPTVAQIGALARRAGYLLVPIPPAMVDTIEDVEAGRNTGFEVAKFRNLSPQAASNRLANAWKKGLIRRLESVPRPTGGVEWIYGVKP